ncbi:MAG TPA: hypothetical protein PLV68_21220, partial [Ilumatobacteraceae bacterium]|nr:hypothetical protein [Ilumatobacteraceae bacterium]
LDHPTADWGELVAAAAGHGGWDQWRSGGLAAAAHPEVDAAPEATRDLLAELAAELVARRTITTEVWEGDDRQALVDSPHWRAGQRRREIIFAIERAMLAAEQCDPAGLRSAAASIAARDTDVRYPDLAESLLACAGEAETAKTISAASLDRLESALVTTPFAAAVRLLVHPE